MKIKNVFIISMILNIIFVSVLGLFFVKKGGIDYVSGIIMPNSFSQNHYYIERMNYFNSIDIPRFQIIFIGDSITQKGEWSELLNKVVINRGINSDTTEGVIHRISKIADSKPSSIFIMIGINDLYEKKPIKHIESNYITILSTIKSISPNTNVYVQSVLPVNNVLYGNKINNSDVQELNIRIEEIAKDFGYEYINLYNDLSYENQLKREYTTDGIHLSGEGYKSWIKHLNGKLQ